MANPFRRAGTAPSPRITGLVAVVTASALWGVGGTFAGELFARGADPLEVVAVRTWTALLGITLLIAVGRVRGARRRRRIDRQGAPTRRSGTGREGAGGRTEGSGRPVLSAAAVGFGLAICVANGALFMAIDRLPVAVALVLQNLAPVFVIALAAFTTRRMPSVPTLAGLATALVGVCLVVELPTTPLGDIQGAGTAFGILTAAAVAAFSVLGGRATRIHGALPANAIAFAVSAAVWTVLPLVRGGLRLAGSPGLLGGSLLIGIFGTLLPFVLYAWGTARVGAGAGAVSICLEPLFGALLARAWLGQGVTWPQLVGGIVLIASVVWLQHLTGAVPDTDSAPAPELPTPADAVAFEQPRQGPARTPSSYGDS